MMEDVRVNRKVWFRLNVMDELNIVASVRLTDARAICSGVARL